MVTPQNSQAEAGPGSVVRALRPALLAAAALSLLPLSASDASWRPWSLPAARSALLTALVLALLVVSLASQPHQCWAPSTAPDVYSLVTKLYGPLLWTGATMWVWVRAPRLQMFFNTCREHEQLFGALDLQPAVRYVRRFTLGAVMVVVFCGTVVFMALSTLPAWLQFVTIAYMVGVYGGVIFWLVIFSGSCRCLEEAFRAVTGCLQTALQKGNVLQLRRLARRHGHLSQLTELLCHTFGGFIAFYLYMLLLDVSLTIYLSVKPFAVPEDGSVYTNILQRLAAPLPLTLLKLVTNAGHELSRQSQQAARLLRRHLLSAGPAAQEPELTELLQLLQGQQAHMDMAGYFTLDRSFFVQSVKDIVTLMIAMAQFEMA